MAPSEQRDGASDRPWADRDSSDRRRDPPRGDGQPLWLAWLQLGISTMLVVLFLVILGKVRQQASSISDLEQKLGTIENARSQDRTTAMEQQLESMIQRLQSLEQIGSQLRAVDRQQQALRQDLQQLRSISRLALEEPNPSLRPTPLAPQQRRSASLPGSAGATMAPLGEPQANP